MDATHYSLIITTAPDSATAEKLAEGLLEKGLVACIHMQEIRSCYVWENRMCKEQETVLWIKTHDRHYAGIESYIQNHHPYDLPEIIKIPVTGGLAGYLEWIDERTGNGSGTRQ